MCIVTKATAIQFIDGKCHIKKWKSCKTALSGYYACVSHDLLLMPSGVDTHMQTYQRLWTKRFQKTRHPWACGPHAPGLKITLRFKCKCMKGACYFHAYIRQLSSVGSGTDNSTYECHICFEAINLCSNIHVQLIYRLCMFQSITLHVLNLLYAVPNVLKYAYCL